VKYKKHDYRVAMMLSVLLFFLLKYIQLTNNDIVCVYIFGFFMSAVEFVCIKMFRMWKYKNLKRKHTIPYWLPFAWSLSSILLFILLI